MRTVVASRSQGAFDSYFTLRASSGAWYRTVSRARPPKRIDVHECGVNPTTRTFVSEGIRCNPPRTGHGRNESNLGRWSRVARGGRGGAPFAPLCPPPGCRVRGAAGRPRGGARRGGAPTGRGTAPPRAAGARRPPL